MTDKPPGKDALPASGAPPTRSKPVGNPAFRMMGLPNIKFKLPSRNWLIFWTVTGSFVSTLLYDRYHKKRVQQKWCNLVSHIADESLPTTTLPRRITIFLAAPPGDSIRAAREHFHEYVKPILVAGALDWEVVEGRREGEVRAGLAEKIRTLRRRNGENSQASNGEESPDDESQEQLLYELRQKTGITEWNGVQGDLILGRHTWKEYVRGLHEGWLGPLNPQQVPTQTPESDAQPSETPAPALPIQGNSTADLSQDSSLQTEPSEPEPPPKKPPKPTPTPPFITPADYSSCSTPLVSETSFDPSLALPLPHLLGFFNTPTRLYRFLTRRRLAEVTGRSVAALVLTSQSRSFTKSAEFASAMDPDEASPSASHSMEGPSVVMSEETWEQGVVLKHEENDWHKSAWKANDSGDDKERVWQEPMTIDNRIGERMRQFELASDEDEKAAQIDTKKRQELGGLFQRAKNWIGWTEQKKKGWEMGTEGNDDE